MEPNSEGQTRPGGFNGLRVLSLESRRATEMAKLIANYGGRPIVAPSMREVPLESNTEALAFARTLADGGFDMAIFLTGVGTRALARVVETAYPLAEFSGFLSKIPIVARGPKPVAALKELGVPVTVAVPEPNTWRELLASLDGRASSLPLKGARVALQEYGATNPDLVAGLAERGAVVTRVPVYQWALPEDVAPLARGHRGGCAWRGRHGALHHFGPGRPSHAGRRGNGLTRRSWHAVPAHRRRFHRPRDFRGTASTGYRAGHGAYSSQNGISR